MCREPYYGHPLGPWDRQNAQAQALVAAEHAAIVALLRLRKRVEQSDAEEPRRSPRR